MKKHPDLLERPKLDKKVPDLMKKHPDLLEKPRLDKKGPDLTIKGLGSTRRTTENI